MKEKVTEDRFVEKFREMGLHCPFSDEGLLALYWELRLQEKAAGYEIELDIVDLCEKYSEYDRALEAVDDIYKGYNRVLGSDKTGPELEEEAREFLNRKTTVIPIEGTKIIIRKFW